MTSTRQLAKRVLGAISTGERKPLQGPRYIFSRPLARDGVVITTTFKFKWLGTAADHCFMWEQLVVGWVTKLDDPGIPLKEWVKGPLPRLIVCDDPLELAVRMLWAMSIIHKSKLKIAKGTALLEGGEYPIGFEDFKVVSKYGSATINQDPEAILSRPQFKVKIRHPSLLHTLAHVKSKPRTLEDFADLILMARGQAKAAIILSELAQEAMQQDYMYETHRILPPQETVENVIMHSEKPTAELRKLLVPSFLSPITYREIFGRLCGLDKTNVRYSLLYRSQSLYE